MDLHVERLPQAWFNVVGVGCSMQIASCGLLPLVMAVYVVTYLSHGTEAPKNSVLLCGIPMKPQDRLSWLLLVVSACCCQAGFPAVAGAIACLRKLAGPNPKALHLSFFARRMLGHPLPEPWRQRLGAAQTSVQGPATSSCSRFVGLGPRVCSVYGIGSRPVESMLRKACCRRHIRSNVLICSWRVTFGPLRYLRAPFCTVRDRLQFAR